MEGVQIIVVDFEYIILYEDIHSYAYGLLVGILGWGTLQGLIERPCIQDCISNKQCMFDDFRAFVIEFLQQWTI